MAFIFEKKVFLRMKKNTKTNTNSSLGCFYIKCLLDIVVVVSVNKKKEENTIKFEKCLTLLWILEIIIAGLKMLAKKKRSIIIKNSKQQEGI